MQNSLRYDSVHLRTVFWPKMGKNSNFWRFWPIFRAKYEVYNQKWQNHHMWDKYLNVLGNSREKNFSHHFVCLPPMGPYASYVKYIYLAIFQNEVGQLQKFFKFLKISHLLSNMDFSSHDRIKTRWDRAF